MVFSNKNRCTKHELMLSPKCISTMAQRLQILESATFINGKVAIAKAVGVLNV